MENRENSDELLDKGVCKIMYKSFIEKFDVSKHKMSDYKLVLVLGKTRINDKNMEGKCLFIPYHPDDERLSQEEFMHNVYLGNVLSEYVFEDGRNDLTRYVNKQKSGEPISYINLVYSLLELGIGVFYDMNYADDERVDGLLKTNFSRPNRLSDKQMDTIRNISEVLKAEKYKVGMDRLNVDNHGIKLDFPDFQKADVFIEKLTELNDESVKYYEETGYEMYD